MLLGNIVSLHADFRHLLSQLQEGIFVQCSLTSLLLVRPSSILMFMHRDLGLHVQLLGGIGGSWAACTTVQSIAAQAPCMSRGPACA